MFDKDEPPLSKSGNSLKQQLLMWVIIPLLFVLFVSAVFSYYRALHFANLAYDRALFRVALALADQVEVSKHKVSINLPEVARDLIGFDQEDLIYYRISTSNGQLLLGEEKLIIPKILPRAGSQTYYDAEIDNADLRVVIYAMPIANSTSQKSIYVMVAETRTKREAMVTEIMEEMILPQLLILILASCLIFIGIKRGLMPLSVIQHKINQRSHLDLSELDTENAPIEIQPLLTAINNLMKRVKANIKQQRQFIADASHQLRTPLAGLQTQAELAIRDQDHNTIHQTLKLMLMSTSRLSHLLNRLLSLASADYADEKSNNFITMDIISLVREVTSEFVPAASLKNIDLGLEIEIKSAIIHGDALMLREVISNLIDNAINYTAENGIISISVVKSVNTVTLNIIDNGIGIPLEQRKLVFERFHRVNDNAGDGCGLGLSIVQKITQAHGATIEIKDGYPHTNQSTFGTHFQITFTT